MSNIHEKCIEYNRLQEEESLFDARNYYLKELNFSIKKVVEIYEEEKYEELFLIYFKEHYLNGIQKWDKKYNFGYLFLARLVNELNFYNVLNKDSYFNNYCYILNNINHIDFLHGFTYQNYLSMNTIYTEEQLLKIKEYYLKKYGYHSYACIIAFYFKYYRNINFYLENERIFKFVTNNDDMFLYYTTFENVYIHNYRIEKIKKINKRPVDFMNEILLKNKLKQMKKIKKEFHQKMKYRKFYKYPNFFSVS